ncbi:S-adenosylmethionine-dependent methyltransferase Rv2258c-like [Babylonia areolata]|uniref:S-adenosylmethionine-dependent methyltransferase Rv2258c-like n=1 Tax=Babylonia areolata TaxID=304850 RepID=UPI003FD6A4DE
MKQCFDLNGPNGIRYESTSFDSMDEIALMLLDSTTEAILQTTGLRQRLENGIKALEVGCGTGRLFLRFASMFPNSHFTLTDLTSKPMERARQHAQQEGLTNVAFRTLDVLEVPDDFKEAYDWIACAEVIHDLPYPLKALQGIHKALRPGGDFSLVDRFVSSYVAQNRDSDESAALYAISTFKCIPESYQQPDSEALGACWGEEKAFQLVRSAGMKAVGLSRCQGFFTLAVCMCEKAQ